jgi:uncharacterized protein (DUF1015 family)
MAEIAPFSGVHYNPQRVPLADVIAPPYDVLSPAHQRALYAKHPDNIVRLILNEEEPGDAPGNNRYMRAAAFLESSIGSGALVQDAIPAIYEYLQRFAHPLDPTVTVERRTLFVALTLAPYSEGVVLPHEETHPKAKADRLELMRATQANPEPIYGLYEDPERETFAILDRSRAGQQPLLYAAVPGPTGETDEHIIYRHDNPETIAALESFFAPRRVWIADGHHRYETALNYQRERREAAGNDTGPQPYDALLIGLSAFEDPGLVVLPTHRLVKNLSSERMEQLKLQLDRFFHVQAMDTEGVRSWIKQEVPGERRFGILTSGPCYALTLRSLETMDSVGADAHCEAWRRLDVSILQMLVLDRCLGISWTDLAHTPDVAYTRDEQEAVNKVASGEFELACLLQNPTVTEVRDVASSGDKMPQKSTFFYPKLWSGLLIRLLK